MKNLRRCIHKHIEGWMLPTLGWTFQDNVRMHPSCDRGLGRFYIVHYLREFIETWLRSRLTESQLEYPRKSIAYQVISMRENGGDLPGSMYVEIIEKRSCPHGRV